METEPGQKVTFALHEGGKYAHRGVPQEVEVEREVRARVYALQLKDKAFQRIQQGRTAPTRKLAKLHRKAKRLRATYDEALGMFVVPLVADLKRIYGQQDTGEHKPAA